MQLITVPQSGCLCPPVRWANNTPVRSPSEVDGNCFLVSAINTTAQNKLNNQLAARRLSVYSQGDKVVARQTIDPNACGLTPTGTEFHYLCDVGYYTRSMPSD